MSCWARRRPATAADLSPHGGAGGRCRIQATAGVPDDEQGLAGGLLNTSLQVGGALGLAVVTAVLVAGGAGRTGPDALLAGLAPALTVVTGFAVVGLLIACSGVLGRRGGRGPAADLQPALADRAH